MVQNYYHIGTTNPPLAYFIFYCEIYIVAFVFALGDTAEAKIDYKNVSLLGIKDVIL